MKTLLIAGSLGGLALLLYSIPNDHRADGLLRVQRTMMGTIWTIEIPHRGQVEAAQKASEDAFAELQRIEALMSEWRPESPISAVNSHAGKEAVEVPDELMMIINRGMSYSQKSGGAFDITWRGMGKLWHFDDTFRVPSPEEVAAARRRVDYKSVEIKGNLIRLPRPGMALGLGGIAKCYAVDQAAAMIRRAGFENYLVNGGGDVLAGGTRSGRPWTVGIQDPRGERGAIIGRVKLTNAALVTSGDYERFRIVDGVRYHHIIDPRTGFPARRSQSVTLISKTAGPAEPLAVSIFILGAQEGLALARAEGVEAMVVDAVGKRHMTAGFGNYFESN